MAVDDERVPDCHLGASDLVALERLVHDATGIVVACILLAPQAAVQPGAVLVAADGDFGGGGAVSSRVDVDEAGGEGAVAVALAVDILAGGGAWALVLNIEGILMPVDGVLGVTTQPTQPAAHSSSS